jgi:predicted enzyme related to lactoylglutathione lyase
MGKHPIVHVEIPAVDTKAAGTFYRDVFNWTVDTDNSFDYVMFQAEGGPGGGFTKVGQNNTEPGDVVIYIDVDDIEASLAKIGSLGGQTLTGKTEVPGMGWFAIFADPTGNAIGLWTAAGQGG